MNKYEIQLTSIDRLGLGFIDDVITLTKKGAEIKEGTAPTNHQHSISAITGLQAALDSRGLFTLSLSGVLRHSPPRCVVQRTSRRHLF